MCCAIKPIASWNLEEIASVTRERYGAGRVRYSVQFGQSKKIGFSDDRARIHVACGTRCSLGGRNNWGSQMVERPLSFRVRYCRITSVDGHFTRFFVLFTTLISHVADCFLRCGGQGYLSCNRFGTFIGLAHAAMTAEGDNSVLMQKVCVGVVGAV
jgi:hypothetical protein